MIRSGIGVWSDEGFDFVKVNEGVGSEVTGGGG